MSSDGGVKFYTHGIATIPVHFANGIETCFNCEFCYRDSVGRDKCHLTREILQYSHTERGQDCPIAMIREEE